MSKFIQIFFLAFFLMTRLFAQDSTSNHTNTTPTTPTYPNQNKSAAKRDRMNNLLRMEEEGDLIFNKQNVFGIHLASDGYGISYEKGKFKTPTKTLLFQFELNEKHSPKEHHISTETAGVDFSSVVPYKENNFYEFKAAIGQQILIGGKGNKNGVAVTALYSGGLTLGMLKPYELDISNAITGASNRQTYQQFVADTTVGDGITGSAGVFVGWSHLVVHPGINAKQAMRFDYGRLNQTVAALEVGLTEEFFSSKMPIMYGIPGSQFFFNAYVAILFGNRK